MLRLYITYALAWLLVAQAASFGHVVVPADSTSTRILAAVTAAVVVSNYYGEVLGHNQLPYSKFAPAGDFPSARIGWALMYAIPAAVYLALYCYAGAPSSLYHHLNLLVILLHYGKRVSECLFLHKYSKAPLTSSVFGIAAFYSLGSVVHHFLVNISVAVDDAASLTIYADPSRFHIPVLVYTAGQLINLVHHAILANLRSEGETKYVVPHAGLFSVVTCPQYFGELIAWFGIAMIARSLLAYASWFTMVVYLSGRALQTRNWYRSKLRDDFPADRDCLVPFIF
ncbi:3-oxo-5-alpha-steroid 4-dehydrogenase 2 [Thecamonas trahens ATCC 50062]|uniref:3-oxo-5-alpha-steroid 4-dehydrogenase 2 n=1 Tax=Thecamonas trahens ATCC 50062 TaxID=461836 RepID=A0A0L0DD74_THETB|nr:3-oxo-5-alpha-steroid 4-dehydrogenase 2 [Thecamonas trahens ATCC 50062]KNC50297.1 3-oxo-5-alpha-steroid 4-dehydrogenase 2 [Thecamonas trahens ATCC 50062]|eukprot:XP_013756844.1 3-oxo-5-alpha-steroid 4-dehydrogenase 2 [Thecamonas trahens ATCC 50062]